jgi:hypothetical protein
VRFVGYVELSQLTENSGNRSENTFGLALFANLGICLAPRAFEQGGINMLCLGNTLRLVYWLKILSAPGSQLPQSHTQILSLLKSYITEDPKSLAFAKKKNIVFLYMYFE